MRIPKLHIQSQQLIHAIEMNFITREQVEFNLVSIRIKDKKAQLVHQLPSITFEELAKRLRGQLHVSLVITGKGLLFKPVTQYSDDAKTILKQLLPEARAEEYCVQTHDVQGILFASLIRSESMEPWLKRFIQEKILLSDIVIGPFSTPIMSSLIFSNANIWTAGKYRFEFENLELKEIIPAELTNDIFDLGNEKMNSSSVHACSLLLAKVTEYSRHSPIENNLIGFIQRERKQRKAFRTSVITTASFLFVLLLVNMVTEQRLSNRHSRLENDLTSETVILQQAQDIENEVRRKKELMGNTFAGGPLFSFISDELGATVPASVHLTELNLFPIQGKIKKDELLSFKKTQVQISGIVQRSQDLNEWIKKIKELDWVKDLSIQQYRKPRALQHGEFKLELEVEV